MEKKTHCLRGHEYTPENTCWQGNSRSCNACRRLARVSGKYRRQYGMKSTSERDEILAAQGGACEICGRTDCTWGKGWANKWHTDHEHGQEGTHRGVLCGRCNTALGNLEPHMDKVIAYLAKYAAEQGASTEGSVT